MRVVMVSDAHLEGLHDPAQHALVSWLDQLECDHLLLLGDIFHHWWGYRGVVSQRYVPICAALLRFSRRGLPVTFVPGNHDFAVGPFLRDEVGVEVQGHHSRELDGVRFHLAHGDEADASVGYALTRAFLRGRPFAALMRALGPARGEALLRRMAGASRHHPADPGPLLSAPQRWARQRLKNGAQVVVLGHIHVLAHVRFAEGDVIHLGDWAQYRSYLEVEDGVPRLFRLDGAVPERVPISSGPSGIRGPSERGSPAG